MKLIGLVGNLIVKGIIGVFILYVINVVGAESGVHVPLNEVTAGVSALLGLSGIVALVIIQQYVL